MPSCINYIIGNWCKQRATPWATMHGRPYTPGTSDDDHRFLAVFDSHQELCVPRAGLCIFSTKLCLSCFKLCAILVVIEVVLLHKITTSSMFQEIMKWEKTKLQSSS